MTTDQKRKIETFSIIIEEREKQLLFLLKQCETTAFEIKDKLENINTQKRFIKDAPLRFYETFKEFFEK
jgi:hypothetical protein